MRLVAAGFLALMFSAGAYAQEQDAHAPAVLGGLLEERDVALFFDYLREAWRAAAEGRELPPPAELAQRGQAIGEEVRRRGAAAAERLIDSAAAALREGLRERPREPAPVPPGHTRI